jgi:pyridoxal phosphate-dependent aminotransferase EpsN
MMKRILLSVPHMGGREQAYVRGAFSSNWLSSAGPNIVAFEQQFEHRLGVSAVAVSSGTAAIHLGLRALGVQPGDTVFCSNLTFVASVNPVRYLGAQPVLIDSDTFTWNMDPFLLARALRDAAGRNALPRAVIVVHIFGQCADMDPIREACARYEVAILEDAAEALGAEYRGKPAGTLGDAGIFSFNGNKIITTTGGGMFTCRDRRLSDKVRLWANQARDPGVAYEHSEVGYNYRMSNVLAGIGRGQLEVLDLRVEQRRAIASRYRARFADVSGISPMPEADYGFATRWLSCFMIDEDEFGCSRDQLIAHLDASQVESRPVWKPMHLQPLYSSSPCWGGEVGESLFRRGICLPSSSSLTLQEQEYVVGAVLKARATRRFAGGTDKTTRQPLVATGMCPAPSNSLGMKRPKRIGNPAKQCLRIR